MHRTAIRNEQPIEYLFRFWVSSKVNGSETQRTNWWELYTDTAVKINTQCLNTNAFSVCECGFMTAVQLCKWFHLGRCGSFTECMYPEQSVLQCLRSLLSFWNRPSLHQNGLNKHWTPLMPTELLWMWSCPSWPMELLSKGSCCSYSLTMGRVYVTRGPFQHTVSKSNQLCFDILRKYI